MKGGGLRKTIPAATHQGPGCSGERTWLSTDADNNLGRSHRAVHHPVAFTTCATSPFLDKGAIGALWLRGKMAASEEPHTKTRSFTTTNQMPIKRCGPVPAWMRRPLLPWNQSHNVLGETLL